MKSLDKIVQDNRFTISVVFPIFGSILLIASSLSLLQASMFGYRISLNFNPYMILLGTIVMRLPLISGIQPLANKNFYLGLTVLTLYSYTIEYIGVTTSWPYGMFEYGVNLGPMIFGKIPLALPIFFLPLVINSYLVVLLVGEEFSGNKLIRLVSVTFIVLLMDIVLDPAAVSLGFWEYKSGFLYGVPLSNFAGWILSATISVSILDYVLEYQDVQKRLNECEYMLDDILSFILLWSIVNLVYQNWISIIPVIILLFILVRNDRFDFPIDEFRNS